MGKIQELYYQNAYLKEFDASVLECVKNLDGKYEAVLDATAFFPEQGGQSSDIGILTYGDGKEAVVSYVSIDKEGIIKHVISDEIPAGSRVHGTIDWAHRFSNMQQHTGEHIFSGIVNLAFGFNNVGFHLSDNEVTMDYDGVLSEADIAGIELKVNQAIWENIEVIAQFPSPDELESIPYRSKKELSGDVRIVTIPGYDICACCAPHVARTGEIGILKVVSLQNYKGGVRVSILCGKRALEFLNREHEVVKTLTGKLTTSSDKIVTAIEKNFDEVGTLKQKVAALTDELIGYELNAIPSEKSDVIIIKTDDIDSNTMRKTVNQLAASHSGICGFFSGTESTGFRYIISTGSDKKDLKKLQEYLKEKYNARGGGSPQMIQGSVSGVTTFELEKLCEDYEK